MGAPIKRIAEWWHDNDFDTVIDVRTPAEFEDDHVLGAINLPVFTNQQRIDTVSYTHLTLPTILLV